MEPSHQTWDLPGREKVQMRGACNVLNYHRNRSSPTEMLNELGWTSLEERRRYQRLIMLFKIGNGLVATDTNEYMTPINQPTRHCNTQAYLVPQSNLNAHKYSFFPRTIHDWNGLSQNIVDAPTVSGFVTDWLRRTQRYRVLGLILVFIVLCGRRITGCTFQRYPTLYFFC